jgi:hypothetical protein
VTSAARLRTNTLHVGGAKSRRGGSARQRVKGHHGNLKEVVSTHLDGERGEGDGEEGDPRPSEGAAAPQYQERDIASYFCKREQDQLDAVHGAALPEPIHVTMMLRRTLRQQAAIVLVPRRALR